MTIEGRARDLHHFQHGNISAGQRQRNAHADAAILPVMSASLPCMCPPYCHYLLILLRHRTPGMSRALLRGGSMPLLDANA